jgi:hypothetical protein
MTEPRYEDSTISATFIVRLCRRQHEAGVSTWSGTLEHVQSGERRPASNPNDAVKRLALWLAEIEAQAD